MAVLAPFNAPAFIAVKKTAYALAAGCPVLLKPSPHAPHAANLIADAMQEALNAHGLPGGYFQLLHGDAEVGGQLAEDPRVRCVTFTGSRAGGQSVAGSAASSSLKPLQLECGSNNPAIVRADADIERTADALVAGMTKLNGQWCEGPGTVFVHERQHDQLIDAVLDRLSGIAVGPARDPGTAFGPQANATQRDNVLHAIERLQDLGAKVEGRGDDAGRSGTSSRPPSSMASQRITRWLRSSGLC